MIKKKQTLTQSPLFWILLVAIAFMAISPTCTEFRESVGLESGETTTTLPVCWNLCDENNFDWGAICESGAQYGGTVFVIGENCCCGNGNPPTNVPTTIITSTVLPIGETTTTVDHPPVDPLDDECDFVCTREGYDMGEGDPEGDGELCTEEHDAIIIIDSGVCCCQNVDFPPPTTMPVTTIPTTTLLPPTTIPTTLPVTTSIPEGAYTSGECSTEKIAAGKDYYTVDEYSIDDCDAYIWDFCDSIGMLSGPFDWLPPNCCIFECTPY